MEAQVQFDELGYLLDDLAGVDEGFKAFACHLRPDDVVVMEAHLAAGLELARRGLTDVVQQGRQTTREVRIVAATFL